MHNFSEHLLENPARYTNCSALITLVDVAMTSIATSQLLLNMLARLVSRIVSELKRSAEAIPLLVSDLVA